MKEERTPLISPVCHVPSPIIQAMPGGRARIDPSARQGLMNWVFAVRSRWDKLSRMTLRGYKGADRDRRKAQIEYANRMVEVCDTFTDSLFGTLSMRTLEECAAYLDGRIDKVPEVE